LDNGETYGELHHHRGDQKEYDAVTAEVVRQWIVEGRLNEQSMVKAEGEAEFRRSEPFPNLSARSWPASRSQNCRRIRRCRHLKAPPTGRSGL